MSLEEPGTRDRPEVSVVVATRDRPDSVVRLLDALAEQTMSRHRFEVILVDDGSRDTVSFPGDPRVDRVLRHDRPIGPASARNTGWRAAGAPLIAFTDDDCRPEPGWLEAGLRAHRSAPGAIVQGRTRPEPEEEDRLDHPRARSIRVEQLGPFFETCNMFYPRTLLERVGGFDETIPTAGSEDTDLALRLFESGVRGVYEPAALVNHAVHRLTLPDAIRFTIRWRTLVRLVKRHPSLRRAFPWRGHVWRESHARLLLALAGLALSRRNRVFLLWCLPYLTYPHGWRLAGLARTSRELPGVALVDAAELVVLAGASARHRRLLL